MSTYKDKYIKYKKKYINLKKGGSTIDKYIKIVNEEYKKSNIVYTNSESIELNREYKQFNYNNPAPNTPLIKIQIYVGLWYGIGSSWLEHVKRENNSLIKKNIFELKIDYTYI